MTEHIENALRIINAMRVDGDNQELAVAAKNELKQVLAQHEYKIDKEKKE